MLWREMQLKRRDYEPPAFVPDDAETMVLLWHRQRMTQLMVTAEGATTHVEAMEVLHELERLQDSLMSHPAH